MPDSTIAFVYLRKSRDKAELADPDLLHKHRRELLRLASQAGHSVAPERIFEEKGSGQTIRRRPACRSLLESMDRLPRAHGGFLWTTEVARLTRGSLPDRARIYESLLRPSVVHCTRAGRFDLSDTHQLHFWEDQAESASYELGIYKDRVAAARLEMALEGRIPTGRPPYGWLWDRNVKNADGSKGAVTTHPSRFPVVQAICRDALHLSIYALEERYGVHYNTIWELLRNPFVCGYPARRNFPHNGDRVRQDNGEVWVCPSDRVPRDRWIWPNQPGDYEPACTREHWEAIQIALDGRRETRAKTGSPNGWCRDVVRFVGDDRRCRLSSKAWDGISIPTYELSVNRGEHTQIYIRRETVHEHALAVVRDVLCQPDALLIGLDAYRASRRPASASDAAALESEIARAERLLDTLLDRELRAADAGDAREVASVVRQRDQYKRELAASEAALKALASQSSADPAVEELLALLAAVNPADLPDLWDTLDDHDRRRVVAGLIEVILCRVDRPGYRWRREVEEVRVREFLRPYVVRR